MADDRKTKATEKDKSLETWIWDAACSICVAEAAAPYRVKRASAKGSSNGAGRGLVRGRRP